MPTHTVYRTRGKQKKLIGYRWGSQKLYTIKKYGKARAKRKANIQGRAIKLSGYEE